MLSSADCKIKQLTGGAEDAVLVWAGNASKKQRRAHPKVTEHRQGTAFSARMRYLTQVRHIVPEYSSYLGEAARGVSCTARMHAEQDVKNKASCLSDRLSTGKGPAF